MSHPPITQTLRLVGGDDPIAARSLRSRRAERDVERSNRESAETASSLSEGDVRVLLAMRVSESLEGGRAAILRPDKRARLRKLATSLGLGDFDTSLVIAIVQDAARRGETIRSERAQGALRLVRPPAKQRSGELLLRIAVALLLATAVVLVLMRWVLR